MQVHLHKCNNPPHPFTSQSLFQFFHWSLFSQLFQSSVHWDWYNIFLPQLAKDPLTNSNCFCTWEFGSGSWKKWEGESVRGCLGNAAVLTDAEGYAEDRVDSSKATLTKSMQKNEHETYSFCENLKFPLLMWTWKGKRRQGKAISKNSASKCRITFCKGNERMVSKCESKLFLKAVQFHLAVPSTSI